MARITEWCAVIALTLLTSFDASAATPVDYASSVTRARVARVNELKRVDDYLALTTSGWLLSGDNTVGSAADNRFRIPAAPAHLGVLNLDAHGLVRLHLIETHGIRVDGQPATASTSELRTQGDEGKQQPTRVSFGSSYLYVVENGTQRGLRVKDNDAPLRTHFPGFDYFPIDPSWRIEADWVPFDKPHALKMAYVTGTESDTPIAGKAVFQRDGHIYELLPIDEDGQLFFVFTDRTAGKLTYGGARFLYAAAPKDGKVLLDFNLAQNPPCAITPHVVCPLAPPENRLKLSVTAGEKKFVGGEH